MQTRYNSTIAIKEKKCAICGKPSIIFSHGRCKTCSQASYKPINRISPKRSIELQEDGSWRGYEPKTAQHSGELQRWFEARRLEMTGRCAHCGGKTCKDAANYKCSIAHILPKAYFPSVAAHPLNWIELCFWGECSCHTQMDNKLLDMTDMACWSEIVDKFQKMYPLIAKEEKRRIPSVLLDYINE